MRTALILGGADCLAADFDRVRSSGIEFNGVVACNDAGIWWEGELDAWVSLHPRYFEKRHGEDGWNVRRLAKGSAPAARYFSQEEPRPPCPEYVEFTDYRLPGHWGSASSGIFATKVALIDLGFDRAVLCGIPMDSQPHWWDEEKQPWQPAQGFQSQVEMIEDEFKQRIRSMSGWTRQYFGEPEELN